MPIRCLTVCNRSASTWRLAAQAGTNKEHRAQLPPYKAARAMQDIIMSMDISMNRHKHVVEIIWFQPK